MQRPVGEEVALMAGRVQQEQCPDDHGQQQQQESNSSASKLVSDICAQSARYGHGLTVASSTHSTGVDDECVKQMEQEQEVRPAANFARVSTRSRV